MVRSPNFAALLWFCIALVLMLTAYIALADLGSRNERLIFAGGAASTIVVSLLLYRLALPSGQLGHRGRRRRAERHRAAGMGVLAAALIVMLYGVALTLDSQATWIGLGIVALGAIGAVLAIPPNAPDEHAPPD